MPAATRQGDIGAPHICWKPHTSAAGSGNVFTNSIPQHRAGDAWALHCFVCPPPKPPCHPSVLAAGSGNVFTNGRMTGRVGDPVACGTVVAAGSGNVFVN